MPVPGVGCAWAANPCLYQLDQDFVRHGILAQPPYGTGAVKHIKEPVGSHRFLSGVLLSGYASRPGARSTQTSWDTGTPTQVTDQISELVNVGLRHVSPASQYEQSQASRGPCTACDPAASRPVFELLSGTHKQPVSTNPGPRRRPRKSTGQSGVPQ